MNLRTHLRKELEDRFWEIFIREQYRESLANHSYPTSNVERYLNSVAVCPNEDVQLLPGERPELGRCPET